MNKNARSCLLALPVKKAKSENMSQFIVRFCNKP